MSSRKQKITAAQGKKPHPISPMTRKGRPDPPAGVRRIPSIISNMQKRFPNL